jgi:hypothetical protein
MGAAFTVTRAVVSVGAGLVSLLALMTGGCNDNDTPSIERCSSFLGNSTWEWSGAGRLVPVLTGILVGCVVWILLGLACKVWVEASRRLESTGDV